MRLRVLRAFVVKNHCISSDPAPWLTRPGQRDPFRRLAYGNTGGRLTFPAKRLEGGKHRACPGRAEDRWLSARSTLSGWNNFFQLLTDPERL
jgi:hypothetical protein